MIIIPIGSFKVLDTSRFNPDARHVLSRFGSDCRCYQNCSNAELESGIYKPKLTISKKRIQNGISISLLIEFSIPKLIFGNNFEEVTEEHFDIIIQVLQDVLLSMAVEIEQNILINAKVIRIHYSKNLVITQYSTCCEVLKIMEKADISKRLDFARSDYKNNGEIIRYHASSYELSFYDKMKDLRTATQLSEKRAFERQNQIQSEFLDKAKGEEVFRMEFRINDMDKLKDDVFKKLNIEYPEPTFKNLFNKELARKACLYFWRIVKEASSSAITAQNKCLTAFQNLIHLGYKPEKAAAIAQAYELLRNGFGMRDFKNMSKPWYKLIKEATGRMNLERSYLHSAFLNIERLLDSFEPLSFSSFNL